MTKNEAYLYAKKIRRQHLSNSALQDKMKAEGYTEADTKLVKHWLSHGRVGV